MVGRKAVIGVMGVLLVVGMIFSVADYNKWRKTETEKYGHGPGEMLPVLALGDLYQNNIAGIRLRYPAGWRTFTYESYRNPGGEIVKKISTPEVVRFFDPDREGEKFDIEVAIKKDRKNVMDEVDTMVTSKKGEGWIVVGERRYWNSGEIPVTGLLMEKGEMSGWWGWAQNGDRLVWINWEGDKTEIVRNEGTFKGVWESVVWF